MDIEHSIDYLGAELFGTVTTPDNAHPHVIAIIHAGSGPTDRDGNNHLGLQTDCLKQLAHSLAQHGISSLRFDKRGIGKSRNDNFSESDLTVSSYVNDLCAWVTYVKEKFDLPCFLIGHSEGSLISSAALLECSNIHGLVCICGNSLNAKTLLLEQIEKSVPALLPETRSIISAIEKKKKLPNISSELSPIFRPSVLNYLKSWFEINPCEIMSRIEVPVLVIGGGNDRQVSSQNSEQLANSARRGKYVEINNMGHTLKCINSSDNTTQDEYTDPTLPISSDLVDCLCLFLNEQYRSTHLEKPV